MLLTLFLLVVFLATAAIVWLHGLWGNLITLVNLIFAALVATSFYEPLTQKAVEQMSAYSYLLDFLMVWLIFAVTFGVMRLITDLLSRRQIQFHPQVELIGRSITALLVGYVMMMFTCMTLHLAPIQASPFNGAWQSPGNASFLGMSPDRQWLGFVRGQSQMGLKGSNVFDPNGKWVSDYFARRKAFESEEGFLTQ